MQMTFVDELMQPDFGPFIAHAERVYSEIFDCCEPWEWVREFRFRCRNLWCNDVPDGYWQLTIEQRKELDQIRDRLAEDLYEMAYEAGFREEVAL